MRMMRFKMLCLVAAVLIQGGSTAYAAEKASCPTPGACSTTTSGQWTICESANFRFCCKGRATADSQTVKAAESLKHQLARKWLGAGAEPNTSWQPKCDVILHTSLASYLQAVPGGEQTVGSSLIEADRGRTLTRRIDIRADKPGWLAAALGHELTHVVLADVFPNGQVPAWADEGMAVLADPDRKQDAHFRDLRHAQDARSTLRLVELLSLDGYPRPDQQAAFYGQSASIVRYLVERETPEKFLQFVRAGEKDGYERALKDGYRINGVQDLEFRWSRYVQRRATESEIAAQ